MFYLCREKNKTLFWANKALFYRLRKRNANRNIKKTASSRNFWICREYAFCLRIWSRLCMRMRRPVQDGLYCESLWNPANGRRVFGAPHAWLQVERLFRLLHQPNVSHGVFQLGSAQFHEQASRCRHFRCRGQVGTAATTAGPFHLIAWNLSVASCQYRHRSPAILTSILLQHVSSQPDISTGFGTRLLSLRSTLKDLLQVLAFRELWRLCALFGHQAWDCWLPSHCKLCGSEAIHKRVPVQGRNRPRQSFMHGFNTWDLIVVHVDLDCTPQKLMVSLDNTGSCVNLARWDLELNVEVFCPCCKRIGSPTSIFINFQLLHRTMEPNRGTF